jgi:hypothetical protein
VIDTNLAPRAFSYMQTDALTSQRLARAVKLDGERDKAHQDLIRHHVMPLVATNAELYHDYRTCETPRRCFEAIFELNRAVLHACTGLACRQT